MTLRPVDPTRPPGMFAHAYAALATTRLARFISRHVSWKLDPLLLRATRGRVASTLMFPTAVLETMGAKSGAPRRNAIIYFHDGDRVIIAASNAGQPTRSRLVSQPRAHPTSCSGESPCASVIDDETEQSRLWPLADNVFPAFASYRRDAAKVHRVIPLVQLTRADFSARGSVRPRRLDSKAAYRAAIPRGQRRRTGQGRWRRQYPSVRDPSAGVYAGQMELERTGASGAARQFGAVCVLRLGRLSSVPRMSIVPPPSGQRVRYEAVTFPDAAVDSTLRHSLHAQYLQVHHASTYRCPRADRPAQGRRRCCAGTDCVADYPPERGARGQADHRRRPGARRSAVRDVPRWMAEARRLWTGCRTRRTGGRGLVSTFPDASHRVDVVAADVPERRSQPYVPRTRGSVAGSSSTSSSPALARDTRSVAASDKRAQATYEDADAVLHTSLDIQHHLQPPPDERQRSSTS